MAIGKMKKFTPPFYPEKWTHTASQITELTDKWIAEAIAFDDMLAALKSPNVNNLIWKSNDYSGRNGALKRQLQFYRQISTDSDIRKASSEATKKFTDYSIEAGMRRDLYLQFKKVFDDTKEQNLDPELKKCIKEWYMDFERKGLGLEKKERNKVETLRKELSQLSIKFSSNLNEQKEHLLFTEEELKGVPEKVLQQYEKVDGKLKVTFKYPDIVPVNMHAINGSVRRKAFLGNQNKVKVNADILKEAVIKRAQLANLLGYKSYAEYVLEERMAKTPETVNNFEKDLWGKFRSKGEKEKGILLQLKSDEYKELGLDYRSAEASTIYLWDLSYYNNLLKKKKFQIEEQKLTEYFPLESTINKMLGFYETLFSLRFVEEKENATTWHPDVKQYALWKTDDIDNPDFCGWIYFDLHPRDGKYSHAAHFSLKSGYEDSEFGKQRPVSALVCNFSKPTKDSPALLKLSEVKTFFHELGHGIHALVSDVAFACFHGTNVARDFVECPSKMLEFWVYSKPGLQKLSCHYKTGERIDDETIDRILMAKHAGEGLLLLGQIHRGLFDMALHDSPDGLVDLNYQWNRLRDEVTLTSSDNENTVGFASFGHMMGGYPSAYYGYQWASSIATDIYYTLFKKDPFNVENGIKYRDTVLKRGGSEEELVMLKQLLGREPNSDAYMEEYGVNGGDVDFLSKKVEEATLGESSKL